jgi:hypothetical protein
MENKFSITKTNDHLAGSENELSQVINREQYCRDETILPLGTPYHSR